MFNMTNELVEVLKNLGHSVIIAPVYKGGVEYTGVSFDIGSSNVRPTIYVESYDTNNVFELAKQMVNTINGLKNEIEVPNVSNVLNWQQAKERLRVCIEPRTNEDVIKRDFLDLQMFARIIVAEDENGTQSAKVTPSLLKAWNITEDELFIKAKENTEKEIQVGNMLDILFGNGMKTSIDEFKPIVDKDDITMFVFTNNSGINGAGGIACKTALKKLSDKFGSGFYILPSSIHELLIIPVDTNDHNARASFTKMVQEVNAGEVKPEEILSNHCYYYNRVTEEIEL